MSRALFLLSAAASLCLCASVVSSSSSAPDRDTTPQYNRDIRPIFAENCFACHGPDSAARKANLRLDQRDVAIQIGAIKPGKPEESTLIERINESDPSMLMPPPKSHKKLSEKQKDTLRRWIAAGAEYQPLWSFIAPQRPPLPLVKNEAWIRTPVDRFVLAELEKRGLTPAPEADRRTLARRLSLDLIGLPPAPADVEAFVNDPAPEAYEKYVDQLLKSPHWGEHRGRHWLDAARYADTHGIHFDNMREMWAYRDWVINAFNRNLPFDQFTIEQLAGDLLPDRSMDQLIATGFNRCNITTNEGGVIAEEYLVLYTRDRTETVSQVWMGLTTGCAVCHDHKFDPISMRDFYSLAAFFNNTTQGAMDGNIKDTPPIITVPKPEDRPRWDVLSKELGELRGQVDARKKSARSDFDNWLKSAQAESVAALVPTEALNFHAPLNEGTGKTLHTTLDGRSKPVEAKFDIGWEGGYIAPKAYKSEPGKVVEIPDVGDFDTKQAFSFGAWVNLPRRGMSGALFGRMDEGSAYRGWDLWIEGNLPGTHIIHKWQEDALKVVAQSPLDPRKWYHVFVTYDGSAKVAGLKVYVNGALQPTNTQADALKGTTKTTVPFKLAQRNNSSRLDNVGLQDLRIYNRALDAAEVERLHRSSRGATLLMKPVDKRTDKDKDELFDWWLPAFDQPYQELTKKVGERQGEELAIKSRGTIAHVSVEKAEEPIAFMLHRGEYDRRGDKVKAETPKSMPAMPADLPRNRLGFAKWLLRPEHPLMARVTVNRFWQELYGTGLVKTSGDFGVTGELPSHPELLDWLALEFRAQSWDMKKFFKMLVMSNTYRQSSAVGYRLSATGQPVRVANGLPTADSRLPIADPENRLLSRGPRYRLDAEMIRDYALASSGLLVPKLGGPSVKPYQPEGVWEAVAMIGSNTRDYRADAGENLYRRSMYTFWKRSAPPAAMEIMNAPNRETCTVRRERTNTPLQALLTLNDPQFVEAARVLAEKALQESGVRSQESGIKEKGIDFIARRLLSRPLRDAEKKIVQGTLDDLLAHYQKHPEEAKKLIAVGESKADAKLDPATLAAWTMVVNELMNLDEVLCK